MNFCYYISDYGYGHASRSIAIIRNLLREYKNVKIFIKIFKENSLVIDRERTHENLLDWINSWDEFIKKEKHFCESHMIDLILSDITPQAFIVAKEIDIPGIAISNFTWHYIFYDLFGDIPEVEQIKDAYFPADFAFALPFNEDMNVFRKQKKVGLVSREITESKYYMRRIIGVSDSEMVIYIGTGRSVDPGFFCNMKKLEMPELKLLVQSNVYLPFENVIRIPYEETETQNYINMCDLVVSKTGYGTISEAIRGRIPMFLLKRQGFKEDEIIGSTIERLGIGRLISEKAFLEGDWKYELDYIDRYIGKYDDLNDIYYKDGTSEIIKLTLACPN